MSIQQIAEAGRRVASGVSNPATSSALAQAFSLIAKELDRMDKEIRELKKGQAQ